MLQPLQIQDVSVRYTQEIAELRDFLAKAGLAIDTPQTLPDVTARLRDDRAFRRDLTSHVWVVLHGGGRQVSHADLFAVLAIAAAGPRLAAEAGDTEAHDLLRYVMQVWDSFDAAPVQGPESPMRRPLSPAIVASTPPRFAEHDVAATSFTRGFVTEPASPSFEIPEDSGDRRRMIWFGAAACALLVVLLGLLLHHGAPANPVASVASTAAPITGAAPQVSAEWDEAQSAQPRGETMTAVARRPSLSTPYSPLPESSRELPAASRSVHEKPSPAIPMAASRTSVASSRSASVRSAPLPYTRSSRSTSAARSAAPASGEANYVPKVVTVDTFKVNGAPTSAGMLRQAVVRPTSLGIMAGNVTYSPAPKYPPAASAARVQGEVKLEAEVGRDGTVESTRIISGPPLLADAAADAVQRWRYRPYLYEGKPIAMNAQIVMDFQLP